MISATFAALVFRGIPAIKHVPAHGVRSRIMSFHAWPSGDKPLQSCEVCSAATSEWHALSHMQSVQPILRALSEGYDCVGRQSGLGGDRGWGGRDSLGRTQPFLFL